ncbi:MAG: type II secretion system F family protein [Candidatus Omnitrophica bacterium]|nr:type II secretion system F family protein [Candidatus Omnitrophota bacterium]
MPKFSYIVRDKTGNKISGMEEGATQDEVVNRLQSKDFIVINIFSDSGQGSALSSASGASTKGKINAKHNRVTGGDLTLFCRQLATLLGSGVTILKSLNIISQQVSSKLLYLIIKDLEKNMEAGLSFHEAMAKHPAVFTELWIHLVESGEASGNLAVVLSKLASYLERDTAFRKKLVSALIYPAILFLAGISALLFMTIKIIPTFAEIFNNFNIKMPFLTTLLIHTSKFIRSYFLLIIVALAVGIWFLRRYVSTRNGKRHLEEFILKVPLLGEAFRILIIERFTSEMSTLVESGVPILYSLEIAEHSVNSIILGEIVRSVKDDVRVGKSLGASLDERNFFDPMVVQMVNIGEEIGELSNMFKRLNAFYQEYLDTFLTRFATMFEPIMLIFIGAVIGLMVIGMFLPIFEIAQIGTR